MSERIPLPMPFGWFRVSESKDLEAGEVKTVRYLGQEFVLFRGEDGQANVVDPYCAHLGAHLGYGGAVEGNDIRCPFHHWKYDGGGQCVDVPYAKKIPEKAFIKAYPTCEKNGIVFMWHHPHGDEPKWEVPEVPEWCAEGWLEPVYHTTTVRSHPQEMAENVVDSPHFHYVHGTPDIPHKEFTFEGHIMRAFQALTFTTPDGELKGSVHIESHGGSIGITRFEGIGETLLIVTGTPVDEDHHETVMRFSFRLFNDSIEATKGLADAFIGEVKRQHGQDVPIWENKKFHENPVLCDGDGPIHSIRKYYQQFYADPV
ncbi:MAG: 3-ketosteroid 9alpha-monooxygenase subunit A [Halioglobus sp.]|jgi:3-ketosteroid 9alpha-monooxygenase subunit A